MCTLSESSPTLSYRNQLFSLKLDLPNLSYRQQSETSDFRERSTAYLGNVNIGLEHSMPTESSHFERSNATFLIEIGYLNSSYEGKGGAISS